MNHTHTLKPKPLVRKFIASLLSFVLVLSAPGARIALAQSADTTATNGADASTDFEIPVLTITKQPSGLRGEPQNITVSVTDDTAVKSVQLFYRFSGNDQFTSVDFERVADSDNYIYAIDTSGVESNSIQYYMVAEDTSGNMVQRGYAFAPLSWPLSDTASTASSTTPVKAGSGNRVLYIVLGVLAAGALASLASSSGGGGDGGDATGCDATGCVLTITSPPPGN